ncbi:MAG: activase, partial [Candidatus Marinimicrobia bacterium]|nr:activase [Candidatus Neomarinimicrobiota bacterium]
MIDDKTYPFGGSCNRYYNIRHKIKVDHAKHDLVAMRQQMVFEKFAPNLSDLPEDAPTVGISRSFLTNTNYPLYSHFFKELGFRPMLASEVDQEGVDQCSAPLCFPCEISHGFFKNLLDIGPDFIFIPHIKGVHIEGGSFPSKVCPLLQGEPYYLRSTFEKQLTKGPKFISPFIDFDAGKDDQKKSFTSIAYDLGVSRKKAALAFDKAWEIQNQMQKQMMEVGKSTIQEIENEPERIGVVLFGRSYNAFVPEANKGIPHKFASRGVSIIPVDFLDLKQYPVKEHMYWSMGQMILKGAEAIKKHPQLFGTFITNFACGPDSFIIGYFRDIMRRKPSLTLELDNHTADAGLETRVEAFLDIVARYRKLQSVKKIHKKRVGLYKPATTKIEKKKFIITTSEDEDISLFDPRVRLVFTSMG